MKKTVALSFGLFALVNTVTIHQAQGIDWEKAEKHTINGLAVVGGVAIVTVIAYCIKKMAEKTTLAKAKEAAEQKLSIIPVIFESCNYDSSSGSSKSYSWE